ncbi:MAG TPA: nucleotidyltransferase [Candidatus Scatomorpha merdipullorum]|uniref:Nucleotidyltransferase n=1 Tax=Candidatus Scatomorpha merdipullorum TaxID=2840927 RepID=A0A9D1FDZ9_9FIRM|nr:nucleotidyltransferase [Candidatus Scatomorpha merdipullorum]
MNDPTLVILAAGLSSRYGSLKQIDPVGPCGEFIIDYSVYDALRAGFKRVVFLIAPDMRRDFEEAIGRRVSGSVETVYAYQSLDSRLPEGFAVPEGRVRPWGTSHALLCCREALDGPFAMINADDFYGAGAYRLMYDFLRGVDTAARPMRFAMVGYRLGNTVTDSGRVCRGACRTAGGRLDYIRELTYVVKTPSGPAYSTDGGATLTPLDADTTVSMNFWGFTPALLDEIERRFPDFLAHGLDENPQAEMLVPNLVGRLLGEGLCTVDVMRSDDVWHGMTYREDKPEVVAAIRALIEAGEYPERLWP